MTDDEKQLLIVKGAIASLTPEAQAVILGMTDSIRSVVSQNPEVGALAMAIVTMELAASTPEPKNEMHLHYVEGGQGLRAIPFRTFDGNAQEREDGLWIKRVTQDLQVTHVPHPERHETVLISPIGIIPDHPQSRLVAHFDGVQVWAVPQEWFYMTYVITVTP